MFKYNRFQTNYAYARLTYILGHKILLLLILKNYLQSKNLKKYIINIDFIIKNILIKVYHFINIINNYYKLL